MALNAELDQGRVHTREQWLRRRDGSGFWCRVSGRAVEPGNPAKGQVWLIDDITQEHEAEERVQRALAEQELILDNASVGIAPIRSGRFLIAQNTAFKRDDGKTKANQACVVIARPKEKSGMEIEKPCSH